ncbi:MAG: tRNA (adenosine(37)-N6)-threonylcarbamoyltransferase complex transferase subunit TsaD [Candidatus Omnitrophica bacterium]|nr:tRNA (adenosine(37)-N6)-threonylcarbamoyltransferase complex transferase subunit TsaD [Candidatus Omnitrophota bacterium]
MITLGIETSCDETSCAFLEDGNKVLSNVISSSLERHAPYGGIVPEIASRHALENIRAVFHEAMRKAGVSVSEIQLVCVTQGPGLIGSLLVGISFAKAFAYSRKLDLIGVNHLEAHLEANLLEAGEINGPYLGLIVSGGHTALVLYQNGTFTPLGHTVDDAVGEAYDKVAKLMGLSYPGGPVIDSLAQQGNPLRYRFTKPKLDQELDFSFSGIKTAVLHLLEKEGGAIKNQPADLAASFQHAAVDWLIEGVKNASRRTGIKRVFVGGGVSANSLLRMRLKSLSEEHGISVMIPKLEFTTDNAAMIAKSGYEKYRKGIRSGLEISANPNLKIGGVF